MNSSSVIQAFNSPLTTMIARIASFALLLCACLSAAQNVNPEQLFQQAVAAQQRGDNATALRLYRELLRTHPEATVVRVNLGATLASMGKFAEAIEQYRAVLEAAPDNRPVRMNLAIAYEQEGDWRRAAEELEKLQKPEHADPQSTMMLADSYNHLGLYARTIVLLTPLEAAQPDDLDVAWLLGSALIHSGQTEQGLARIDKVAAKGSNADAYLLAGQTRLARSEYDLARHDADLAMQLDPQLAGVQTLYGMVLEQMGDYAGAEAALRKAIAADPDDFSAHLYLGAILYFRRDMSGARIQLEQALQLQPASAQARYELALVVRAEGHFDVALKALEIGGRSESRLASATCRTCGALLPTPSRRRWR